MIKTMNQKIVPAFSYDFLTPFYDSILNLLGFGIKRREGIVELLNLKLEEKLLDVGCGTGSLLIVAKKKYPEVEMAGIDVDKKVLQIAQTKIDNKNLKIKLILNKEDRLPFEDASFDKVVSSLVFHHMPTEVKINTLKEIYRVLKKDGSFLLVDFGKLDFPYKILWYLEVLFRVPEAETSKDNVFGKIPGFLKETGFEFKEVSKRYFSIQYLLCKKSKLNF